MFGYLCADCQEYWSCQAGPEQGFRAITTWCPKCLPRHVQAVPETRFPPGRAPRHLVAQ